MGSGATALRFAGWERSGDSATIRLLTVTAAISRSTPGRDRAWQVGPAERPVSMLLHIGHDHAGQRRDVLRVAGHAEILSDEIDVEGGPLRIPHEGLHGKADTAGIRERPRRADLETEPVAKVQGGRLAEVRHGNLPSHLAVEVNVDSPPDADFTGEQRGRAFDDPALVDEVERSSSRSYAICRWSCWSVQRLRVARSRSLSVRARRKAPGLPYERPPVIDAQIRPGDELAASRPPRKSVRPALSPPLSTGMLPGRQLCRGASEGARGHPLA